MIFRQTIKGLCTCFLMCIAIPPARATLQVPLRTIKIASAMELHDMSQAPQMVVIPAGEFIMGSPVTESGRSAFEDSPHRVVIQRAFAVAKYDVTFDQWDACVADGGCNFYRPDDAGWGRGSRPVINVSWSDAQAYVAWLSRKTGQSYRLLSEAEWEYSTRAGSASAYPWGDDASHDRANYGKEHCCSGLAIGKDLWEATSPVGSFPSNAFGLFDMQGDVMQYVQDCWHANYLNAPADGTAWNDRRCSAHVLRGGSWSSVAGFVRSADRIWITPGSRFNMIGFRVARTL